MKPQKLPRISDIDDVDEEIAPKPPFLCALSSAKIVDENFQQMRSVAVLLGALQKMLATGFLNKVNKVLRTVLASAAILDEFKLLAISLFAPLPAVEEPNFPPVIKRSSISAASDIIKWQKCFIYCESAFKVITLIWKRFKIEKSSIICGKVRYRIHKNRKNYYER
ncbi:conserved hypothetical protein [Trichinella spiralis]|uniref:hypothetical protein n=1 Tax=Trichinella spiralis TaxID=6334 RepID=UPI0001EFCAEB|nr:conserved hypothetical protein [Trichinella spiralis]